MSRRASGEGTIRKRTLKNKDGTSRVRWFARITTGWDGHKKTIKEGPWRKSQQKAKLDLKQMLDDYEKHLDEGDHTTVEDFARAYLTQLSKFGKFRTFGTYRQSLEYHVLPVVGAMPMAHLSRKDVQRVVDKTYAKLTEQGKDGRAVTRKAFATLRTLYNHWLDDLDPRDPSANRAFPFRRILLPKEQVNEPKLWSEEEARAFLTVCRDNRAYPIIYTALTSGLREGELLALTWDDFEVFAHPEDDKALIGSLHVTKSLTYVSKQDLAHANANLSHLHKLCFLGSPKTKSSIGYVTIPGDTVKVLLDHRERLEEESQRPGYTQLSLMFPTRHGLPMTPKNLYDIYQRLIKKAGVPRISFHDLRDTHATRLLAHSDIGTVSGRLRHSTKSTTLNRYVHVLERRKLKGALPMDQLLKD